MQISALVIFQYAVEFPKFPTIMYLFGVRLFHITLLNFQWFTLDEVSKGKLHLKLEWLTLMPTAENLDKVFKEHITFILVFFFLVHVCFK